ncbi:hypothetical protein KJ855_01785 [Patescibacteria group bacterium]|nr:hypothetical protein [Patescibacteria group bacterium]
MANNDQTVYQAKEEATAVFYGTVLDITEKWFGDDNEVMFEVGRVWKGEIYKYQTIYTAPDAGMCGSHFEVGQDYVVFAYGDKQYKTSKCGRTKLYDDAMADLLLLGKGGDPIDNDRSYSQYLVYILIFVILFLLIGVLAYKRKK